MLLTMNRSRFYSLFEQMRLFCQMFISVENFFFRETDVIVYLY
jgi:hypothetical protein